MNSNLIVGVGIKTSLFYNQKLKNKYRILLSGAVAVSMLLSLAVHFTHRLPKFVQSRKNRVIVRVTGALLIVGAGWLPYADVEAWLFMTILAFVLSAVNLYEFSSADVVDISKYTRGKLRGHDAEVSYSDTTGQDGLDTDGITTVPALTTSSQGSRECGRSCMPWGAESSTVQATTASLGVDSMPDIKAITSSNGANSITANSNPESNVHKRVSISLRESEASNEGNMHDL